MGASALKLGCQLGYVPPGGIRGESHSLHFLASKGCLCSTGDATPLSSTPHPCLPTRQEVMVTQPGGEFPSKVESAPFSLRTAPKTVLANVWRWADQPIHLQQHFQEPENLFSHQMKAGRGWGYKNMAPGSMQRAELRAIWVTQSLWTLKAKPLNQTLWEDISQKTSKKCAEWMLTV